MRIRPTARVLLALAAALCACAQGQLTMAVFNYAGTPRSTMAPAVEIAKLALLAAGIHSQWLVCDPEGCVEELASRGAYLELFVMPHLRTPLTDQATDRPAGYAMTNGFTHGRAYAFQDAAKIAADRADRPLSVVLGCILIHEAGHLLGLNHQSHGVMRANLEAADMDNAIMGRPFNADEGKRLRAAVNPSRRLRASARR
jgi:hypothetical protein